MDHHENRHSRCFQVPRAESDVYKNSFFVKTTSEWNSVEEEQVNCSTLDGFKAKNKDAYNVSPKKHDTHMSQQ